MVVILKFLMSIIYKIQIIVLKNDSKGLILETDTDKLYSLERFGQGNIVWIQGKWLEASSRSGEHRCIEGQLAK